MRTTRASPALESAELSVSCLVSADGALTAGANPQASPAAAAMENSQTGKKTKKKRICAFIRRKWRDFKSTILCWSRGNKVSPLWPQPHTDPSHLEQMDYQNPDDPQPGPSGLKAADWRDSDSPLDPDDPQPGPSGLDASNFQDSDDSQPGSSNPEPDDPQPGPSGLEPTLDTDLADPAKGPFHLLYDVGKMLGAGFFGRVYEGTRIYDGKQVAIKFIQKKSGDRLCYIPDSRKPLFAEVALNLLLQKAPRSQHVLRMYQWFDEPERRILILEHPQPCETLQGFIWHKGGRLDETLACGLMRQAVLGFRHCLDRGVDHNDIKTDNILVNTETLQLKLIDFGCGILLEHGYKDNQGRLSQHTDASTVFSLGLILYKMVNGKDTVVSDLDHLKFDVNVSKGLLLSAGSGPYPDQMVDLLLDVSNAALKCQQRPCQLDSPL